MKCAWVYVWLLFALLVFASHAQCDRKYPSGYYHNGSFVNPQGDTLNRLDANGYYHGLHVYTFTSKNIYNDSTTYILGRFNHGLPVGQWLCHCSDSTFSIGEFGCGGGEQSYHAETKTWTTKRQGIYNKKGVWKFYGKNKQLIETLCYKDTNTRRGWTNATYRADSAGHFVLIEYEYNNNKTALSRYNKTVSKKFTSKGVPISYDIESFWHEVSYKYTESGRLLKKTKYRKFFGKELRAIITKEYNYLNHLRKKTKTKVFQPSYIINESW